MKKTRYIIIDENRGVFLGTYTEEDIGKQSSDNSKNYALFACNNPFGVTKACSFSSEEKAIAYIQDVFPKRRWSTLSPKPVESDNEYPDVVDIIKSGYSEYTYDMIDGLFDLRAAITVH